jgi:hypothetical protein
MYWLTIVLYGFNFSSFVGISADVFEILISCAVHLRDFRGECSSPAPILFFLVGLLDFVFVQ